MMEITPTPFNSRNNSKPQARARRDLVAIGTVVFIGCLVILADPDRVFEWVAHHEEVQVDELLSAIVTVGAGFAIFSWRRWTDLSRQVAEYKRLQAELGAIHSDAVLMGETDDLLQSCLTTDEAYKVVIRHFEIQLPTSSGAVFAYSQDQDLVLLVANWGRPSVSESVFAIKDCWALRRGRTHASTAADPRLACSHICAPLPFHSLCLPMMAQGETLGVLYVDGGIATDAEAFSDAEQRTIKTLAEHLALAVANLNLRETLRTQSIRDPLTGLFNRRYMEESIEREFRRTQRKEIPLAMLMIDLDHFKHFNDEHGHEAGDAVLRELAKVLQSQLRAEDIASRYGGEEFLLILPETNLAAAEECAERVRTAVQSIEIHHYGRLLKDLTLSIGLACYPKNGLNAEALLRAADAALYGAKERGRNCVVTAD